MILFTDLDNTIIYSYKHDIGEQKRNVELYQGREISFITNKTYELLCKARKSMRVVPISTRTIEQYNRIDLGVGEFPYALVCNGGILLINGKKDTRWYNASLEMISESESELKRALELLEIDDRRSFELRFIENLFIFTKCENPERVVIDLRRILNSELVDVFNNGAKVYVVPKALSKGNAIKRFLKLFENEKTIAAGDSEFDISMLKYADIGLCPKGFIKEFNINFEVREMTGNKVFSEELLLECLKEAEAN